jgi:hypothetical protein
MFMEGESLDQQPVHDWASLQRGEFVEVRSTAPFPYAAYVDDLADDGRLIWLIEKNTGCRRLFVHDDPVTLYFLPDTERDVTPWWTHITSQKAVHHA